MDIETKIIWKHKEINGKNKKREKVTRYEEVKKIVLVQCN